MLQAKIGILYDFYILILYLIFLMAERILHQK